MIRFLVVLSAISILASGCGGGQKQSKEDRAAMNKEFAKIDFQIAQYTMGPGRYADQNGLKRATRRYVQTIRKYRRDLGKSEVDQRLTHEAEQVGPWCPPCVGILRREADAS